jgi:SAM-dependent methyltransferase
LAALIAVELENSEMLPLDDVKYVHLRSRRRAARPDSPGPLALNPKVTVLDPSVTRRTASAYDHVGEGYSRYADGDAITDPSESDNRFAHADTIVWETLRQSLEELREAGVTSLRVLDAGCGPGIWTKRIAEYAHRTGLGVAIVGFDISKTQLEKARQQAACLAVRRPNGASTSIEFLEQDLSQPLPWADGHFHVVLCNYAVLNHLTKRALPQAIAELCRVATHRVIATVRSVGSPASACIIGTEQVADYRHDPDRGQLALVLKDGSQHRLSFNVYPAQTLAQMFSEHGQLLECRALDLFLSRFAPDEKWTATVVANLPERPAVLHELKILEDVLCRAPGWVDHGTHVLLVAQPNAGASGKRPEPVAAPRVQVAVSFAEFLANQPAE